VKKYYQIAPSIFWFIIGVFVAIYAYQLGLGRLYKPGPGFIFFLAGLLLTILSIIDIAGIFIGKYIPGKDEKEESVWLGFRWQKVLLVLGALSAYAYFFNMLGFLLSTFLLMVFLFKAVKPTRWWIAIVSSLVTTLLSYVIFKVWLMVPFPPGILSLGI
jgi:putative tricarboxylic transport membrane protein